jgi:drug/metabolite transporter (DMT)-like permease
MTSAFATVLGWWLLDETPVGTPLAGMFDTLSGVVVVVQSSRS